MKNYEFCPYCGNKYGTKNNKNLFDCSACKKIVFINSVPAAGIFLVKEGKYALCKRAIEPQKGMYDFLGGFMNNGEDPMACVIREMKEETGLTVKDGSLLGTYNSTYESQNDLVNVLVLIYVVTEFEGDLYPKDDVAAVEWFDINTIPNNIAFECIVEAIKDLQKWYKNHSN